MTALSKAANVKKGATGQYLLHARVDYNDGEILYFNKDFPDGTKDWNRGALLLKAHKPIKTIRIYPLFRGDITGTAWFDDFRLIEGNILTSSTYTKNDLVEYFTDEAGRTTKYEYDEYGNKKKEINPKGFTKSYKYTKEDQLELTTLPNDTTVEFNYDFNGNIEEKIISGSKIKPDGQKEVVSKQTNYLYTKNNKLSVYKDGLNEETNHYYDDNGNRNKTSFPNGNVLEWEYNTADRLENIYWTLKDAQRVKAFSFTYDPNGNETNVADHINGIAKEKGYKANLLSTLAERGGLTTWQYFDTTEKLKYIIVKQGAYENTTAYEYNKLNQNNQVRDGGKTYYFDYDEYGNVYSYITGNGIGAQYDYDNTQKIKELSIAKDDGTILSSERYTYDDNGNRTSVVKVGPEGKTETASFEFDEMNQLVKEKLPDGTEKSYVYDGFGNRANVKVTSPSGIVLSNTTSTFDLNNRLETFGNEIIEYDDNSNRTKDGKFSYRWNAADQLESITRIGETAPFATYRYDEDGRRIEKTVIGQVTRYHYDGDSINVLYETDGKDVLLRQYVYNTDGVRLAMKVPGKGTLFYHYNAHGDVIGMTDEAGNSVASYSYDAWGNPIVRDEKTDLAKENPFTYAGYMFDEETGMYYLMARYYHPEHGVFISVDPDPGDADDPVTQNGYAYANNNPVMMIDPDGHVAWWVAAAVGGAAWDVGAYLWNNRNKGYSWKGVGKSALRGAITGVALGGAGKLASKVLVKSGRIFRANGGEGFKITKNIRVLYENPNAAGGRGGTFIAKNSRPGRFRLEWSPKQGYHGHWGKTNSVYKKHRSLSITKWGKFLD